MKFKLILLNILVSVSVLTNTLYAQKVEPDRIENIGLKYYGNITAPDFPKDIEWLNTDKPVSLKDLKGKIVLIISGHTAVLTVSTLFPI